jgi:hypothetical protein
MALAEAEENSRDHRAEDPTFNVISAGKEGIWKRTAGSSKRRNNRTRQPISRRTSAMVKMASLGKTTPERDRMPKSNPPNSAAGEFELKSISLCLYVK